MDRLLASDDEIEASRAVRDSHVLAEELKKRGVPDDETAKYKDLVEQGAEKAKARLFRKLMGELKDEKRAELAERRKEIKKRVAGEVWEMPEYKALSLFRRPRDKGGLRISMLDIVDLYGDEGAKKLLNELPLGVVANDGIALEEAAELAGYPAGEALLDDLKKAKALPPQTAIAQGVNAEMAPLESAANDPEALRNEVEEALHGEESSRPEWIAMEERLLREAAEKAGKKIAEEQGKEERKQERREKKEAKEQEKEERRREREESREAFRQANEESL
jgi:hypothetical protein